MDKQKKARKRTFTLVELLVVLLNKYFLCYNITGGGTMDKQKKARKRAFTLEELLVVLLILGVLVGLAVPRYIDVQKSARLRTFVSNIHEIESALETYRLSNSTEGNKYPDNLNALQNFFTQQPINPYTGKSMLSDNSEDSGIQYQITDNEYSICITQQDVDDVNNNGVVEEVLPLSNKTACIGNTQTSACGGNTQTSVENSVAYTSNGAQEVKLIWLSRPSDAHTINGKPVGWNVPRFEQGKFGKAIMIEEGTTNWFDMPIGISGSQWENDGSFYPSYAEFVRISETDWAYTTNPVLANNGQTWSVSYIARRCTEDGEPRAAIGVLKSKHSRIGVIDISPTFPPRDIGGGWMRYEATFTINNDTIEWDPEAGDYADPAYIKYIQLLFYVTGGYHDFALPQIEQKPYATSFINGTREPDYLTIPVADVFNKSNWTLEFRFNPTSNQVVPNKTGYLWSMDIDPFGNVNNNYYALKVGSDGKPYLEVKSNGTIYRTSTAAAPVLNVGTWYDIKIRGNGSLMAIAVDGTKISEVSYVEPVGNLPANMYIGSDHNGSNHANVLFDDLRISAIARSDTEWTNTYTSGEPLLVDEWTTYLLRFDDNLNYGQGGYYISPEYDVSSVNKAARGKVYWQEDADGIQRIVYAKLDNQADWTQVTNGGLLPISAGDVLTNRKLQLKVKMLKVI